MSAPHDLPNDAGADPKRSAEGGVHPAEGAGARGGLSSDPLFQAREPEQSARKSTVLLWQFFFFPLLIVVAALGVILLFGLAGDKAGPDKLLERVLEGGENERRQATQQLAIEVTQERSRFERQVEGARRRIAAGESEADVRVEAPFYASPTFRRGLRRAFELALEPEGSPERRLVLARMLGRAQDLEAIPLLTGVLFPAEGGASFDPDVRRAAAVGLMFMESRAAAGALLRAAADTSDNQVRSTALNGLAMLGWAGHGGPDADDPRLRPLLVAALADPMAGVRVNAAFALAVRGDPSGVAVIREALDREALTKMGIPEAFQGEALRNAARAAAVLGDQSLKPLVERLTSSDVEGDADVRRMAQEALDRWPIGRTN